MFFWTLNLLDRSGKLAHVDNRSTHHNHNYMFTFDYDYNITSNDRTTYRGWRCGNDTFTHN